jgi:hypothetical protein
VNASGVRLYMYSRAPRHSSWLEFVGCAAAASEVVLVRPNRRAWRQESRRDTAPAAACIPFRTLKGRLRGDPSAAVLTVGLDTEETCEVARLKRDVSFRLVCLAHPGVPFAHRQSKDAARRRRHAFPQIDRIVVQTQACRRVLEREYVPAGLLSSWTPGVAIPEPPARDRRDVVRAEQGFTPEDFVIGCFGPHERDAAALSALDAFRSLSVAIPMARLWWAGWGRGARDFRDWSGLLGLRQNEGVAFCALERTDEQDVLAACDAFVFLEAALDDPVYAVAPRLVRALASAKPVFVPDLRQLEGALPDGAVRYPAGRLDRSVQALVAAARDADPQTPERRERAEAIRDAHDPMSRSRDLASICQATPARRPTVPASDVQVSVIMPCYNRANLIHRALDSIRGQKGVDRTQVEILVIDDGSEDDLGAGLSPYPEVTHVRLPHTGRVGHVRNEGLRRARGRIIAYLDSDDRWEPGHLRGILRAFRRDRDLGMVITGFRFEVLRIGDDGRVHAQSRKPFHPPHEIITDAVAHRRECSEVAGEFPDFRFAEDYFYWKRIMDLFPFRRLRQKTAVYSFTEKGNNLSYAHSSLLRDTFFHGPS